MDLAIVSTLIKLGLDSWSAWCAAGIGEKEVATLANALSLTAQIDKARGKPRAAEVEAQHLAMVLAAFGRAYSQHWAGTRSLAASRWDRLTDKETRARQKDIETRLGSADLRAFGVGDRAPDHATVEAIDARIGNPLAHPAYRELWRVFSDPALTDDGAAPLLDHGGEHRRAFERDYLLAWWASFNSPVGQPVRAHALTLEADRERIIRECLIADIATWDERHVFGNKTREAYDDALLPFLPLGEMYIEPDGAIEDAQGEKTERPILELLNASLERTQAPYVTVVKADFGRGKSLTARRFACELARRYLGDPTTPSPELWRPIFVRCAEDATIETLRLDAMVRSAIKRQADDIGLSLGIRDPACALPDDSERVLIVLDGLDEVVLGLPALAGLFKHLREEATARRRILVMSRPGVLPERRELRGAMLIELCRFRAEPASHAGCDQIDRWLDAWNRLTARGEPITHDAVSARGLLELAETPILLFMIAHTWDAHPADGAPSHARLYETFFAQMARGKHARDADTHPAVYAAAEALRERLITRDDLDPAATPADAMLWLLARLAWLDRQKAWKQRLESCVQDDGAAGTEPEPLTDREVTNLIRDELRLDASVAATVRIGVLLTLQADPTAGCDHIHFGHKSFREFLVARYWAARLQTLADAHPLKWEDHTHYLLNGRLLMPEDGSFEFLMQIVAATDPDRHSPFAWNRDLRESVRIWAEVCFNDERQDFSDRRYSSVRDDRRAVLREAALAIGSRISESHGTAGLRAKTPGVMRSLLAWFWVMHEPVRIIAPRAKLGSISAGIVFWEADFRAAELEDAAFPNTRLQKARFSGANLRQANFYRADLALANLQGADLQTALLVSADLRGANLQTTNLTSADLGFATLLHTDLSHASLRGAELRSADLRRANLHSANLLSADLQGANLQDANLFCADLRGADLRGADLQRAALQGADLRGAASDGATRWPAGFDPIAAGVAFLPD